MLNCVPPSASLSMLAHRYDLILCDVWGVIHDGVAVHPAAREALSRFRKSGGSVILLSNASRLSAMVTPELERLGMSSGAYDALITSGDITRDFLSMRPGISVFDVGPGNARAICEGLDVQLTKMQEADIAIAGGAFQDDKAMDQLRPLLHDMLCRRLLLLCANPDVVTELAGRRVKCSGALAEIYAELGGPVHYAGKPHKPIFERALALAAELRGEPVARRRVLVIGDSIRTDIAGARANGFDSLFVASGIHARELGSPSVHTPSFLQRLFGESGFTPSAVTWRLFW
jgi:HAD superfamily hydrolase (TIGR01459 family)